MSGAPLTIGLLTPAWPGINTPNGIVTSVVHLAAGLREIGHKPVILGWADGPLPEDVPFVQLAEPNWSFANKMKAKIFGGEEVNTRLRIQSIVDAARTARRLYGIDALIMEESKGWAYHVTPAVPVPVVVCLHGPWALMMDALGRPETADDRARIELEAKAFARAAGIIAPSRAALSVTDRLRGNIARVVIPNACPIADGRESRCDRPGHLLYVGRVERLKGADTVLSAFERLIRSHPDARLTFVGPDYGLRLDDGRTVPMEQAIKELAPDAADRIDYLGRRTPAEIAELRKTHPIALMASRFETLSYTMLEAMAAGQALISTRVGGPAEVLEDDVSARLVSAGDPEAMAAALAEMLDDPTLQRRIAEGGSRLLAERFGPAKVAGETVQFLRGVLDRRT